MKTILKAFLLLVALTVALPVFAQSNFETTKARAEAGDAEAQAELGFIYGYGRGEGATTSIQEALRLFRLSAEQGNARAQYNLGVLYHQGRGVAQNDQEAVKLYRLAAEQGNARAQYNLGVMYGEGRGVAQNDQEAVKLYRLAAEQGFANAQYNLGFMYANGRGVAQNYDEAVEWYRLAAEQGNAGAQYALRSFFETSVTSREYFIDDLVVILSERKTSKCDQGGDYSINITGDVGPDSSFALEELLKISPSCIDRNGAIVSRTTVTLSSAGGLIEDGYKMGQLFRANGVHTKINDNLLCASSCAVAYSAVLTER